MKKPITRSQQQEHKRKPISLQVRYRKSLPQPKSVAVEVEKRPVAPEQVIARVQKVPRDKRPVVLPDYRKIPARGRSVRTAIR